MDPLSRAAHAGVAFLGRHRTEIVGTLIGAGIGGAMWLGGMELLGVPLVLAAAFGGLIAVAFTEGQFREQQRREREAEAERTEAELEEMRTVARFAREILLDASVWTDVDGIRDQWEGEQAHPSRLPLPLRDWSIGAIVARGRGALRPIEIRGWGTIAQLIGDHADYLTVRIDQEFPGQPAERRAELSTLFKALRQAVSGAQQVATARERRVRLAIGGSRDEQDRADQALRDSADFFFGACEWVQACVEKLDDRPEFAALITAAAQSHRAVAARILAAQREIQVIATAAAEQLLRDGAPAPEYLERSTIGDRGATLRDLAATRSFAFAGAEEEQALNDWRSRIARAQRAFHLAVIDRGGEMAERTHALWGQIHNDRVRGLEQAVEKLGGDVHALTNEPGNMVDAIERNVAERRDELHAALRRIVASVDEFAALRIE